jgi:hypothetical protein
MGAVSTFVPPWQWRPPRREPQPREPTLGQLALAELKRGEPQAGFGGRRGEMAVPRNEPAPPAPEPFVIPPPPWSENYRPELDPEHEPPAGELDEEREPAVAEEEP